MRRWEALLLVMDSRPFYQMPHILSGLGDGRIWVYAEMIDERYTPRTGVTWTPGYHGVRLAYLWLTPARFRRPFLQSCTCMLPACERGCATLGALLQSACTTSRMRPSGPALPARAGSW